MSAAASSCARHHGFIVTSAFTVLLSHGASDTDVPPVTEEKNLQLSREGGHGFFRG
jgi:hypothetical protein